MNHPTATGLLAMLSAYRRIQTDGHPHFCPVRIGKRFGPAIETAILRKLTKQGFSDGALTPQLTQAGIDYLHSAGFKPNKVTL